MSLAGWYPHVDNIPEDNLSLDRSTRYYPKEWLTQEGFHPSKKGKTPPLPQYLREDRIYGALLFYPFPLYMKLSKTKRD